MSKTLAFLLLAVPVPEPRGEPVSPAGVYEARDEAIDGQEPRVAWMVVVSPMPRRGAFLTEWYPEPGAPPTCRGVLQLNPAGLVEMYRRTDDDTDARPSGSRWYTTPDGYSAYGLRLRKVGRAP